MWASLPGCFPGRVWFVLARFLLVLARFLPFFWEGAAAWGGTPRPLCFGAFFVVFGPRLVVFGAFWARHRIQIRAGGLISSEISPPLFLLRVSLNN